MAHVARFVIRHRLLVVGAWIVLTVVGMFSAAKLSSRWFQSFSIPGYSAYEANQRTLKAFGSGEQVPPAGVTSHLTGRDAIFDSQGGSSGPGVFTETLIGAVGALIILLFVFGTLPAIGLPLAMAAASILTTFACVLALTYVTDVSI